MNTDVNVNDLNFETKSVINFLEEDNNYFDEYVHNVLVSDVQELGYSNLLAVTKLEGTTREGVDFKSYKVKRARVSEYIRNRYLREKVTMDGD